MTLKSMSAALALVLAAPVQADVYRWVDARGGVSYGEKPPAGAQGVRRLSIEAGSVSIIPMPKPRAVFAPPPVDPGATAPSAPRAGDLAVAAGLERWREQCFAQRRVDCDRPTAATFDVVSSSSPGTLFAGPP